MPSQRLYYVPSFTLFPFTYIPAQKGTTYTHTYLVPFYLNFPIKRNNPLSHVACSFLPIFPHKKEQPHLTYSLFLFREFLQQKRNNLLHISKFFRTFAPDFSLFPFSANNRTKGTTHP